MSGVRVYEKIPLVQRPLSEFTGQSVCRKKTKTKHIYNAATEQSSNLGKDKSLSCPLLEENKHLKSVTVQMQAESHTQKKDHLCKKENPVKYSYSSTHGYNSPAFIQCGRVVILML